MPYFNENKLGLEAVETLRRVQNLPAIKEIGAAHCRPVSLCPVSRSPKQPKSQGVREH